ncbi:MAG: peptidoglycan DD-metalloendopeptidase family protein [Candidatus Woesearchaeota archaeon]
MEQPNPEKISRRDFLKSGINAGAVAAVGLSAGALLNSCAFARNYDKPVSSLKDFDYKSFKGWFRRNLWKSWEEGGLYRGRNPYLPEWHTFQQSIWDGWTPGIDWKVSQGTPVMAIAPGKVIDKSEIKMSGHAGGWWLRMSHNGDYSSAYAHLDEILVDWGKPVERGQIIGTAGSPTNYSIFKLVFFRTSNTFYLGYHADPNNYGDRNDYMQLYQPQMEGRLDREIDQSPKKREKRLTLLKELDTARTDKDEHSLFWNEHSRGYYGKTVWSEEENFKFLYTMYKTAPMLFPNLNREKVESMKKEFLDNQPIILTHPLKG